MLNFPIKSSSIPTQFASHMEQHDSVGSSGDVVIVVPSMDNLPEHRVKSDSHSHHICIDAEADMEPNSPKTITESSSEFKVYYKSFFFYHRYDLV